MGDAETLEQLPSAKAVEAEDEAETNAADRADRAALDGEPSRLRCAPTDETGVSVCSGRAAPSDARTTSDNEAAALESI